MKIINYVIERCFHSVQPAVSQTVMGITNLADSITWFVRMLTMITMIMMMMNDK